jgi:hypothetical protein
MIEMVGNELSTEYQELMGLSSSNAPVMTKASGKRSKKVLAQGVVEKAQVSVDTNLRPSTKLMKIVSITRTATDRIAKIEMRVKDGTLFEIDIDEPTAQALVNVFLHDPIMPT